MTDKSEEPKLIIDEDYKSQVEREKQEAQQAHEQAGSSSEPTVEETQPNSPNPESPPQEAAPASESEFENLPPPPPASLQLLVTSLATQAMAAMGQLPDPNGQAVPANIEYARHFIDLIGMLEEKTAGNLSDEESQYLRDTLHQLRMMFVEFSKSQ